MLGEQLRITNPSTNPTHPPPMCDSVHDASLTHTLTFFFSARDAEGSNKLGAGDCELCLQHGQDLAEPALLERHDPRVKRGLRHSTIHCRVGSVPLFHVSMCFVGVVVEVPLSWYKRLNRSGIKQQQR
jgi:hypothetical protein